MIEFLRRLFRSIFGSSDAQPAPEPQAATPAKPQASHTAEPEPEATAQPIPQGSGLLLQRYSEGTHDTIGKLYLNGELLAYTLEDPAAGHRIAPGSYTLTLIQEGGRHTTYAYRFGDYHKGLIAVSNSGMSYQSTFHIGNTVDHLYGSILLGQSVHKEDQSDQKREVWYSENAYRKVYDALLPTLQEKGELALEIS